MTRVAIPGGLEIATKAVRDLSSDWHDIPKQERPQQLLFPHFRSSQNGVLPEGYRADSVPRTMVLLFDPASDPA